MKYTYQKKAKLVGDVGNGKLWLINCKDDWIHDQYGESYIYYGIIYSRTPFHPLSLSISGYFQECDTKKWIKVKKGAAFFPVCEVEQAWHDHIEDFIHVEMKTGVYKYYKKV
ncbi:molecular chaperone GrpE [Bacillus sp. Bva_UNVM-123]|uniref:molecular chaperone GrpE n=1 Tax=Bacillus sp. Bva_UNVM-123 TaxID=2829798 RepID=UPI00391F1598